MAAEKPYRVEAAPSARSTCTISKAKIEKGELRLGSFVSFGGRGSYKWRRLACITAKQAANIEKELGGPEYVDGFAELAPEQQAAFVAAFKSPGEGAPGAAAAAAGPPEDGEDGQEPPAKKPRVDAAPKAKAKAKGKAKAKAKAAAGSAAAEGALALTPELIASAHAAIDLAKAGAWDSLYKALEARPGLVDVRPEVREFSVLHQAAFHGSLDAVRSLIEVHGADPGQRTKSGKSVADVAREHGHAPVADFVAMQLGAPAPKGKGEAGLGVELTPEKVQKEEKSAGCTGKYAGVAAKPASTITPQPAMTPTVVHTAHRAIDLAKDAQWEDLFTLLDFRRDVVNVRPDVRDFGVLHQAAFHGDSAAVDALLGKYGADPAQRTRSGKTAADVAREHGHDAVAAVLRERLAEVPKADAVMASAKPTEEAEEDDGEFQLVQMPDGTWKVKSSAAAPPAAEKPAVPAPPSPETEDEGPQLVQMPDGTWKVRSAGGGVPEQAPVQAQTVASAAASSSSSSSSSSAGGCGAGVGQQASVQAQAAAGPAAAAVDAAVDPHCPEAATYRVHHSEGVAWSCELKRTGFGASGQACVLQLLEVASGGGFHVWVRSGSVGVAGERKLLPASTLEQVKASFQAQFEERTGNRWQDRSRFKPFFGKYALAKPGGATAVATAAAAAAAPPAAGASPTPAPAASAEVVGAAHRVIDMAKAARWGDLYKILDARPELVNVRPDVREFSALHQAAYHGNEEVVATLIGKYGADPAQKTKLGVSAAVVALGQGHTQVADFIAARLPA